MTRDQAMALLRRHEPDLKQLGVERLYLFGSTARDEAKDGSDVDLFFDYERGTFGLFELMDVKSYTSSILGSPTDIITRDSLHEMLRRPCLLMAGRTVDRIEVARHRRGDHADRCCPHGEGS